MAMKRMAQWTMFLVGLAAAIGSASSTELDWPMYRHDAQLTSFAPGKGGITNPSVM